MKNTKKMKLRRFDMESLVSSAERNPPKQKLFAFSSHAYTRGLLRRQIISAILIMAMLVLILPRPVQAGWWGEGWASTIFQITYEKVQKAIEDTLVANAKVIAIRVIQGRLNILLTGSCGKYCIGGTGAMFITDWQDFIFGSAQRTADRVVNDFFMGIRSGTTASMQRVVDNAQRALDAEVALTKTPPDLQNYVSEGKATLIFDPTTRNPNKAWIMATQPQNDPAYRWLQGYAAGQEAFRREEEKQKTMAGSYSGYKPVESGGSQGKMTSASEIESRSKLNYTPASVIEERAKILVPGSLLEQIHAEGQMMGMKMIEFAQSIPEIVSAMVVQTLTNLINYGIKQITDPIDRSITQFRNQVGTQIWNAQSQIQQGARENIYFNRKK